MKLFMYCVYDAGVEAYNAPQFFRSKGEAIRAFSDAVQNEGSPFSRHAGDYGFYCVGVFDDSNGSVVPTQQPERVITAIECLKVAQEIK